MSKPDTERSHGYLDDTPVTLQWLDGKFERIAHPHGPDWTVWRVGRDTLGRLCFVKQVRQENGTFNVFYCGQDEHQWKVQMVNAAKHLWLLVDAFGIESDVPR